MKKNKKKVKIKLKKTRRLNKLATNRKLGRTTDIRMAMLKNLTTDLLVYGKVETTLPRAKEVKSNSRQFNIISNKRKKTTLKKLK